MSQKKVRSSGINKNWHPSKEEKANKNLDYYIEGLKNSDLKILSEALTLIENQNTPFEFSLELLEQAKNLGRASLRIGVSGSPGVGKSTFINALGSYLNSVGKTVAVLAVDPSSEISKGSILGDKTRMHDLVASPKAYVRPSPSNAKLGGIAPYTKEAITLCEAAGFEVILIESVGVGQSETMLSHMVDLFCLLLLPGAGDDLQGIKKGIVELSDVFIINKSDDERATLANKSKRFYKEALHLQHSKADSIVTTCSSLTTDDMPRIWKDMQSFVEQQKVQERFEKRRKEQDLRWLNQLKEDLILSEFVPKLNTTTQTSPIYKQAIDLFQQIKKLGEQI